MLLACRFHRAFDGPQVNIGVRILHRPKDVALPEVFQKYVFHHFIGRVCGRGPIGS